MSPSIERWCFRVRGSRRSRLKERAPRVAVGDAEDAVGADDHVDVDGVGVARERTVGAAALEDAGDAVDRGHVEVREAARGAHVLGFSAIAAIAAATARETHRVPLRELDAPRARRVTRPPAAAETNAAREPVLVGQGGDRRAAPGPSRPRS